MTEDQFVHILILDEFSPEQSSRIVLFLEGKKFSEFLDEVSLATIVEHAGKRYLTLIFYNFTISFVEK